MAVAPRPIALALLTYEAYMAEDEVMARYDIVDGARIFMTNPNVQHQEVQGNFFEQLRAYQRATRRGRTIQAPCDVLIRRAPLRTRQPDLLFITHERFGNRSLSDPSPLEPAPELVVEILSPSETRRIRDDKIADYCAIDVRECWIVDLEAGTIEVLRLTLAGAESVATYGASQTLRSVVFPDLTLDVAEVLTIEG